MNALGSNMNMVLNAHGFESLSNDPVAPRPECDEDLGTLHVDGDRVLPVPSDSLIPLISSAGHQFDHDENLGTLSVNGGVALPPFMDFQSEAAPAMASEPVHSVETVTELCLQSGARQDEPPNARDVDRVVCAEEERSITMSRASEEMYRAISEVDSENDVGMTAHVSSNLMEDVEGVLHVPRPVHHVNFADDMVVRSLISEVCPLEEEFGSLSVEAAAYVGAELASRLSSVSEERSLRQSRKRSLSELDIESEPRSNKRARVSSNAESKSKLRRSRGRKRGRDCGGEEEVVREPERKRQRHNSPSASDLLPVAANDDDDEDDDVAHGEVDFDVSLLDRQEYAHQRARDVDGVERTVRVDSVDYLSVPPRVSVTVLSRFRGDEVMSKQVSSEPFDFVHDLSPLGSAEVFCDSASPEAEQDRSVDEQKCERLDDSH